MSIDTQDRSDYQDVIVDGHLNLRKIEQKIRTAAININLFYSKKDPEEKKVGVPYQYQLEHQAEWDALWLPINQALAIVDTLVMNKHEKLFAMEIAKSQQQQPPQQTSQLMPAITNIVQSQQKEKKPGFSWPWSRKTETPTITPFKMSIQEIIEKKKIKELFYDVISFHAFMVEYGQPMILPEDLNLKMNWMPYEGLANLLTVERNEFKIRIQPVITMISEGHDIIRQNEQRYAVTVETAAVQLKEKHDQKMAF